MANTSVTKKKYLYEVDFFRIVFIFGVLFNHTTTLVGKYIASGSWEAQFLNATHLSLHFTRMGFMFITGLVLFLNYYYKEMHPWSFWRKRYISVGIPYVSWTVLLLLGDFVLNDKFQWGQYWRQLGYLLVHGTDYYMYYILVTFQLYLIFPLLVWLFKRFPDSHDKIVLISLIIQVMLLTFLKYGMPQLSTSSWPFLLKNYGFNIIVYQFYFILGAYASIHYKDFVTFIEKRHRFIGWMALILGIGTLGEYSYNQHILHLSLDKTLEIHQPYIFLYDVFVIGFIIWLGLQYAKYRENGLPQWFTLFIATGAKISFGIYLGQTVALTIIEYAIFRMFHLSAIIMLGLIPIWYILVIILGYGMSWLFLKIPPFGFLIGRPQWHISKLIKK